MIYKQSSLKYFTLLNKKSFHLIWVVSNKQTGEKRMCTALCEKYAQYFPLEVFYEVEYEFRSRSKILGIYEINDLSRIGRGKIEWIISNPTESEVKCVFQYYYGRCGDTSVENDFRYHLTIEKIYMLLKSSSNSKYTLKYSRRLKMEKNRGDVTFLEKIQKNPFLSKFSSIKNIISFEKLFVNEKEVDEYVKKIKNNENLNIFLHKIKYFHHSVPNRRSRHDKFKQLEMMNSLANRIIKSENERKFFHKYKSKVKMNNYYSCKIYNPEKVSTFIAQKSIYGKYKKNLAKQRPFIMGTDLDKSKNMRSGLIGLHIEKQKRILKKNILKNQPLSKKIEVNKKNIQKTMENPITNEFNDLKNEEKNMGSRDTLLEKFIPNYQSEVINPSLNNFESSMPLIIKNRNEMKEYPSFYNQGLSTGTTIYGVQNELSHNQEDLQSNCQSLPFYNNNLQFGYNVQTNLDDIDPRQSASYQDTYNYGSYNSQSNIPDTININHRFFNYPSLQNIENPYISLNYNLYKPNYSNLPPVISSKIDDSINFNSEYNQQRSSDRSYPFIPQGSYHNYESNYSSHPFNPYNTEMYDNRNKYQEP